MVARLHPINWEGRLTAISGGTQVTIREALAEQSRINTGTLRKREHITLHPHLLYRMGHKLLRQVRVVLSTGETRVMTVEVSYEDPLGPETARMHADAYSRFGVDVEPVQATIYTGQYAAVDNRLSQVEAEEQGDHIEFIHDNGVDTGLWVNAPHGGQIERWTDIQVEYIYTELKALGKQVTAWGTLGYTINDQSPTDRWHTTAVDFHPDSYPLLAGPWARTFSHGIGVHGYSGVNTIELGGLAGAGEKAALTAALQAAIPGLTVNAAAHDDIDGDSPRNITNRLVPSDYTFQLEQSWDVRRDHWQDVADVIVDYFKVLL